MRFVVALLCILLAEVAAAQSAASQASSLALDVSVDAGSLVVRDGSRFVITALRPVGKTIEVSVRAVGSGASAVLRIGATTVAAAGLSAGVALVATAVSAGWVLRAGGEIVAFVPNESVRSHIHRREL